MQQTYTIELFRGNVITMPKGTNTPPGALTLAIAEILRAEMGRRSYKDAGLARASGVDRSAIGRIVKGQKVPDIEVLEALCVTLGRTLTSVLKEAEAASEGRRFDTQAAR
jgi:transcriptional regulator with XRE-family HTH domain